MQARGFDGARELTSVCGTARRDERNCERRDEETSRRLQEAHDAAGAAAVGRPDLTQHDRYGQREGQKPIAEKTAGENAKPQAERKAHESGCDGSTG